MPVKEPTNRDLVMWMLGTVCSIAGVSVILLGGVWLGQVETALAQQKKAVASHETRVSVLETQLGYIVSAQERLEGRAEEQSRMLQGLSVGQQRLATVLERLDRGR